MTIEASLTYKFANHLGWASATIAGQTASEFLSASDTSVTRNSLVASIKEIADYNYFEYDRDTQTYKSTQQIYIRSLKTYASYVTLTFSGEKLTKIYYSVPLVKNGVETLSDSTILLSYGSVVLDPYAH
jgi:hypothetical protein